MECCDVGVDHYHWSIGYEDTRYAGGLAVAYHFPCILVNVDHLIPHRTVCVRLFARKTSRNAILIGLSLV